MNLQLPKGLSTSRQVKKYLLFLYELKSKEPQVILHILPNIRKPGGKHFIIGEERCVTQVRDETKEAAWGLMRERIRGCLHDTGATFAPRRAHSGSLSWLYICLHDTTTKCRPGVSSLRLSHRGENFTPVRNLAAVSCKHETTTRFGVKSVCR